MSPETLDPVAELSEAVRSNDAGEVSRVLESHPGLRSRLDEPPPDSSFGATFLLVAVGLRNRDMIDALLRAGADINARSQWWAGSFGVLDDDHGLDEFLIERGARVDAHVAARMGRLDLLNALVTADPGVVHQRGGDGQLPLHFASTVDIARYLLDHGTELDAIDIDHESTAAQWLIRDHQDVVRDLVSRGCRTDLLMAAALGDLDLARRHLAEDPERIRMSVTEQWFPRRNPRSAGTIYIWKLGANRTAHLVAREFGHEEMFRYLLDRTPLELKLALACELGDEETFDTLLAQRPDFAGTLTDDDRRKLVDAAEGSNLAAVRLMLRAGWPADARGRHGATALHWAAFHGNADLAREILRHAPPLETRDRDFDGTPLGWAIYGSVHGWHSKTGDYAATVEALLDAGAKAPPDPRDASAAVREVLLRRGS